jgi:hypothetical protein
MTEEFLLPLAIAIGSHGLLERPAASLKRRITRVRTAALDFRVGLRRVFPIFVTFNGRFRIVQSLSKLLGQGVLAVQSQALVQPDAVKGGEGQGYNPLQIQRFKKARALKGAVAILGLLWKSHPRKIRQTFETGSAQVQPPVKLCAGPWGLTLRLIRPAELADSRKASTSESGIAAKVRAQKPDSFSEHSAFEPRIN